ncbi:hypothetical protein IQ07DRAFT_593551 [Pyrenochaeta sp. DS3sAY3a]|nr:hypothetical protein IQ07DRAFT_593551 [Pyrenochaeta sp. DS3sAY3a]
MPYERGPKSAPKWKQAAATLAYRAWPESTHQATTPLGERMETTDDECIFSFDEELAQQQYYNVWKASIAPSNDFPMPLLGGSRSTRVTKGHWITHAQSRSLGASQQSSNKRKGLIMNPSLHHS